MNHQDRAFEDAFRRAAKRSPLLTVEAALANYNDWIETKPSLRWRFTRERAALYDPAPATIRVKDPVFSLAPAAILCDALKSFLPGGETPLGLLWAVRKRFLIETVGPSWYDLPAGKFVAWVPTSRDSIPLMRGLYVLAHTPGERSECQAAVAEGWLRVGLEPAWPPLVSWLVPARQAYQLARDLASRECPEEASLLPADPNEAVLREMVEPRLKQAVSRPPRVVDDLMLAMVCLIEREQGAESAIRAVQIMGLSTTEGGAEQVLKRFKRDSPEYRQK